MTTGSCYYHCLCYDWHVKKTHNDSTKDGPSKPRQSLVGRLFYDKQGKVVIFQIPNLPIIIAGLAWLAILFVHSGALHTILEVIFNAGLIVWAVLEIGWGATVFRRVLGLIVLVWIIVNLILGVYVGIRY